MYKLLEKFYADLVTIKADVVSLKSGISKESIEKVSTMCGQKRWQTVRTSFKKL